MSPINRQSSRPPDENNEDLETKTLSSSSSGDEYNAQPQDYFAPPIEMYSNLSQARNSVIGGHRFHI